MLELGLKFTFAYLLGAVMGALVVAYLAGGVDIRSVGSGNPGATNALRALGKWAAFWVMLIDIGKGIVAVALIPRLPFPGSEASVDTALLTYACGLAAILGHVFPVWFGFKGGKGGATAAGLICFLAPGLGAGILALWLGIIFFTGYVGLATMSAAAAAACYVGIYGLPEQQGLFVFTTLIALLIIYTHRSNIFRMMHGTESRFGRFFGLR